PLPDSGADAALAFPAFTTAATILRYPVQRQRIPPSASCTSASVGWVMRSSSADAAMSRPGVHAPHCAAPCSRKAACSTDRRPLARPSTVLTVLPATLAAGIRQAPTGAPSTRTVQAPQSPASQPILVPVSPSSSRSTLDSLRRGGTRSETGASFTLRSIAIASRLMLPTFRCQSQLLHILHAAR